MKFLEEEVKKIAAGGAFLQERMAGNTCFIQDETAKKRFQLWQKKAGGSGGESAFCNRLEAESIDMDKAIEIAGSVDWNENGPLPFWTGEVNALLEILPIEKKDLQAKLKFKLEDYMQALQTKLGDQEDALEEVREIMCSFMPFLYQGEQKLEQKMKSKKELFSEQALIDMSAMLARGLYYLLHKVWAERFKIFILRQESFDFLLNMKKEDQKRYRALFTEDLLAGGWKGVFAEYPVLARFITIVMGNWVNNMEELAVHLEDDRERLNQELNQRKALGKVKSVHGNISDSHNKGKGVMILHFEAGTKIVYKPRNLGLDIAYDHLIRALSQMDFPYELKAPKALAAGDHGWIEFIEYQELNSLAEAKTYYHRAGALLCLVYVLGGNDFHGENIIASGTHPVLVDLETIISYKMIQFHEEFEDQESARETQDFIDLLQESVLGIGFLPIWITANEISVDFGALTGSIPTSIPGYGEQKVNVFDHEGDLREGFRHAYDFFVCHRDALLEKLPEIFQNTLLRIILRPTNVYAKMLYHGLSPQFLKDGFIYSVEMERMAPAFLIKVGEEKVKKLWPLFQAEREALEGRDIPIFYGQADERHIRSGEAVLCRDYFADSALGRVRSRLQRLTECDKERQLDYIRESLKIHTRGCHSEGERNTVLGKSVGEEASSKILLTQARKIYQDIMSEAVRIDEKNQSWISYQYDLIHGKTYIGQTTFSLYDGLAGIALLSAAFSCITGEEEPKQKTLQLLNPFRDHLGSQVYPMPVYRMQTGLGNGLGGLIQAFLLIGAYLEDDSLLHDTCYLVDQITENQIKQNKQLTVYTGLSGLIPGLLNVYQQTTQSRSLDLAVLCGRQILKNKDRVKKSGWGDGAAGLAFALAKLYQQTGEKEFQTGLMEIAVQGKSWHRELQSREKSGELKGSLCSGLAGLGMTSMALHAAGLADAAPDLEMIIREVRDYPLDYVDHFCCGNSGRLEFLLEAGQRLNRPELCLQVNRDIHSIIARKNARGDYQIMGEQPGAVANPSFFQGQAGIGYLFLRSMEPEKVRSIII